MGLFRDLYYPPFESWPAYDESLAALELLTARSRRPINHQASDSIRDLATTRYLSRMLTVCHGRSLFKTAEGRLGLGPQGILTGDKIYVILGCASPMILRESTSAPKNLLVGEASLPSLMSGEAIMGPLPDRYQFVFTVSDEAQSNNISDTDPAFYDTETDETRWYDPRLDTLYDVVSSKAPELKDQLWGFELLKPDNLRIAGVHVETLELV